MINFHKYGFLDCKRLSEFLKGYNIWLHEINPVWLFLWSDLLKPEIAFKDSMVYIRYLDKELGIIYYPPIGSGDFKMALYEMRMDAKELGVDFNIAPIDNNLKDKLNIFRVDTYPDRDLSSYIYTLDDLTFSNRKYKKINKGINEFFQAHDEIYYKSIKKDDFPAILEFINYWSKNEADISGVDIYKRLNMIKRCMEHLYELNLCGIIIKDIENIYGVAIGSILGNTTYLHLAIATDGAMDLLIQSYARLALSKARYINLENDYGNKEVRGRYLDYKPLKIEEFYRSFQK